MTHRLRLDQPVCRRRQRGAALLTALVVVSLVATLAAGMIWQQWRAVQVESAERARVQAYWVLNGALDWARLILREDGKSHGAIDELGEPWATPLAEARLSTFLAVDKDNSDDAPEAFLSGQINDEQARFNLNTLYIQGERQQNNIEALRRLCDLVGAPVDLADMLADKLHQALVAATDTGVEGLAGGGRGSESGANANAPLMPMTVDDLLWLGVPADALAKLRPYITLLPEPVGVNLNTAPKEVIAAVVQGMDLASAERLVQHRQGHPLKDENDVIAVVGRGTNVGSNKEQYYSSYFSVQGRLRFDDRVVEQRFLVYRTNSNDVVPLRQERVAGLEAAGASGRQP